MVQEQPHLVPAIAGWVAALLVGAAVIALAPRLRAMAHPNERSSHTQPTPTLGGLSFVVPLLVWLVVAPTDWGSTLLIPLAVLAVTGLLDDLFELPNALRLLVQVGCVAGWLVLAFPDLPLWWYLPFVGAVVWFVNLCNFMDGIDGIMATQALTFVVSALLLMDMPGTSLAQSCWLIAGGMLGFLSYNWPPARLFMGDVGSLVLGLMLAALALEMARQEVLPLVASVVLLSVFWFDASYTLIMRVVTRQNFLRAHKSHLYQRMAQWRGHLWTTAAFATYAMIYLLPLAWLSVESPAMGWWAVVLAVLPLAVLGWRFRAGLVS